MDMVITEQEGTSATAEIFEIGSSGTADEHESIDMTVYTIGYGGRRRDEFLDLLTARGIKAIVDVRLKPRGYRGHWTKAKDPGKGIEGMLASRGIEYVWIQALGNPFKDQADRDHNYRRYLDELGSRLREMLQDVPAPFCLLCAEKRVEACHRRHIACRLTEWGTRVEHIE